jgi:hypothetical protein
VLDPWLGEPRRRRGPDSVSLVYRFAASSLPAQSMQLKVEINTRDHFSVLGVKRVEFVLDTLWHVARVICESFRATEGETR